MKKEDPAVAFLYTARRMSSMFEGAHPDLDRVEIMRHCLAALITIEDGLDGSRGLAVSGAMDRDVTLDYGVHMR
jgi:hypothetical protein